MKLESHAYIKFPCGTEMQTDTEARSFFGRPKLPEMDLPPTLCPLHGTNCKPAMSPQGGNGHALPSPGQEIIPPAETLLPEIEEVDDPNKPEISIEDVPPKKFTREELNQQLADAKQALAEILGVNPPQNEDQQAEPLIIQGQVLPTEKEEESHSMELPPLTEEHLTIQTKKPIRRR